MAVAGLHNISGFGPFFGESQSEWDDQSSRPSTRASSLLQMWRELEGNHSVSHSPSSRRRSNVSDLECLSSSTSVGQGSDNVRQSNVSDSECLCTSMSVGRGSDHKHDTSEDAAEMGGECCLVAEMEHQDCNSIISEQSSDMGGTERDRVRQIFQEWMNGGSIVHASNGLQLNHRSGVHMNGQERNNQEPTRDGAAEAGAPIEHVRDGLVITHPEIGPRRPIRKLCGRQTLLDLLLRFQCEKKTELEGLLEQRPVSDFAHRNRIQALLRGRFLRNERFIPDKRQASVAATELGLLRQRHTVSGLREEFLSKFDSSASTSVIGTELGTNDANNGELESTCRERDLDSVTDANSTQDEVSEVGGVILHNDGDVQEVPLGFETATCCREEKVLDGETTEQESSAHQDNVGSIHHESSMNQRCEEINTTIANELMLETDDTNNGGPHNVFYEHHESSTSSYAHEVASQSTDSEQDLHEQFDLQDTSAQVDESPDSITEIEDSAWQQLNSIAYTGSTGDVSGEEMDRSWEDTSSNQLFQETSFNNDVEHYPMQESQEEWQGNDVQEAIDSWLDMPSIQFGTSARISTLYFPDDDNSQSIELQELFSRRRVSSLLQSGFRESLSQVLQSHAERLTHVLGNWELDNESSPSLVEQDQGQQNVVQALPPSDAADTNPFVPTLALVTAFPTLWDDGLQVETLPHNSDQLLGTEWVVINELRINMARLQQRMNNIQSMLEACIDMQIELQRSVRQEVSSALNRSIFTTDAAKGNILLEEISWDYVRRGICCLCSDSKIDSLLYRCGHMCSCSKCAEKLVRDKGKCPMCQAPVVEAVRAYFIQ